MNEKKLYKSSTDKKLAGVCGGIAQGGLSRRLPARSARQGLPRRAVAVRRVKRGAHRVKARRHPLHQHTIPSFSGYIRGGWLPPAF